ncbi:helix-turn-helix domain-containing protein [Streptomyces koelreuteriae]|uniref:Helix-turn-helix domain-containing protein n=1 Tax=Streptomyces koelreuteriae TaxID=2838015 RepID=A0ABX8FKD7_9ACTN|nr:helix-turn-helix domain-containing protein [Streptomyces koelreuteriae]
MKELAGRLTALDPDAGAAVRVIAYFDRLAESRAGVEALVRGAAVLSGCPARLVDPERRVHVRVQPDGARQDTETPPDPTWPSARLSPNGPALLWLERGGGASEGAAGSGSGVAITEQDGATPSRADEEQGGAEPGGVVAEDAGAAPDRVDAEQEEAAPGRVIAMPTAAGPGMATAGHGGATPSRVASQQAEAAPGRVTTKQPGPAPSQVVAARAGTQPGAADSEPAAHSLSVVDAVILERAAAALRLVLDRTRGRAPADDPALVETLLDATAPEQARLYAARRLGLDLTAPARVLAPLGDRPRVVPAGAGVAGVAGSRPAPPEARLGVGPAVPVLDLPRSWTAARTALRFTAEGTPQDPGPRVVHADELGGIALLADLVVPGAEPPPDVRALEAAAATTPWLSATLHAVASTTSLRAAAAGINVHHSTLQDRLTHAEHLLGWPLRTPQGRLRLQLALAMRHLARP